MDGAAVLLPAGRHGPEPTIDIFGDERAFGVSYIQQPA
jgi:hypothetical protein